MKLAAGVDLCITFTAGIGNDGIAGTMDEANGALIFCGGFVDVQKNDVNICVEKAQ